MSALDYLIQDLDVLAVQGLGRRLRTFAGSQNARIHVDGRDAINFSSNNYLGLAGSPILRDAAIVALSEAGFGSGASRLIIGNHRLHRELESHLASFHDEPAAILFNSGYQANVGILSALVGPDDIIYSDELNHASIIDGCRLSRARTEVYRHVDLDDLLHRLRHTPGRRRIIVTDSIFSMDGDLAPLTDLRRIADAHGAALYIDEAHATGVVGPAGRGLAAALGVRSDIHVGTLSKGLGCFGAYATGPSHLVEYLLNRCRSFVFSTALPPLIAAAADAALRLARSTQGDELRARLRSRCDQFRTGLAGLGLLAPGAGASPIFPIRIGDDRQAMVVSEALLSRGIFAHGIRPPTVPHGTARLRFALMATHTQEDVELALHALEALLT